MNALRSYITATKMLLAPTQLAHLNVIALMYMKVMVLIAKVIFLYLGCCHQDTKKTFQQS